ncbi:MAG TPA: flavodoxin [Actinomycetota bacterium]|nr:flavodoxin [Actinomycetota bacterium]
MRVVQAIVIYESMFGNNQLVARAIAAGLTAAGVSAEAVEVGVAPTVISPEVDLLVLGSPNHAWSMPRPSTRQDAAEKADGPVVSQQIGVREWLGSAELPAGLRTAAYDTRGSHPKVVVAMDHASTSIDKGLAKLGGTRLAPSEHFRVADVKGPLEPGEVERAQVWGRTLAGLLNA